jgi:hypothetical protein
MSIYIDRIKNKEPEGGAPIFKFEKPGDLIVAKFCGRRTVTVKSIKSDTPGRALDVIIIESEKSGRPGPAGPHTIFESDHITQLLDGANLKPGNGFSLRYDNQNRSSRFKAFAFEKLSDAEAAQLIGVGFGPNDGNGASADDVPW